MLMGSQWALYTEIALVWASSIRRYDRRRDIVLMAAGDIPASSEDRLTGSGLVTLLRGYQVYTTGRVAALDNEIRKITKEMVLADFFPPSRCAAASRRCKSRLLRMLKRCSADPERRPRTQQRRARCAPRQCSRRC